MSAATEAIRKQIAEEAETFGNEFPQGFTLEDEEDAGVVILTDSAEEGGQYRCYLVQVAKDDWRVLIDDYFPPAEGIEIDEWGAPADPADPRLLALEAELAQEQDLDDLEDL